MKRIGLFVAVLLPWVALADSAVSHKGKSVKIEVLKVLDARGGYIRREGNTLFLTSDLRKNPGPGCWLDIAADPGSPTMVCDSLPGAWDIAVAGDCAFVCDYTKSFSVYGMHDRQWQQKAKLKLPSMTENVVIRGDFAYIANHVAGLTVVNISNPLKPVIVSNFNPDIDCDAIGIWQDCAVLYGHWESRLVLVDISDPAKPRQTGVYQNAPKTFNQGELEISGGVAYCTALTGIVIVDVRDPVAPKLVKNLELGVRVTDVAVMDGYAYLAAGSKGIVVLDVKDPANPVEVGRYQNPKTFAASQLAVQRGTDDRNATGSSNSHIIYAANAKGPAQVLIHKNKRNN